MSKWQPIETAPTDTPVQVYVPDGVDPNCFYLYEGWPNEVLLHVVPAIYARSSWREDAARKWYSCISECDGAVYDDDRLSVVVEPTHWMPLPDPPSMAAAATPEPS